MKVLIVSDTHGNDRNLERVLLQNYPMDAVFHLGDMVGSESYIEDICPCPVNMVSGNNDFLSPAQAEQVVEMEGHRIFMTHGHRYGVTYNLEKVKLAAEARKCDLVFCGHSHRPLVDDEERIIVVNPGSLTYPRQENRKPSYILMHMDADENVNFEIIYLD